MESNLMLPTGPIGNESGFGLLKVRSFILRSRKRGLGVSAMLFDPEMIREVIEKMVRPILKAI
jgi:hypothetical protein